MHVVVSWDIKASGERWTQIDTMMREALHAYSCVQPLPTFHIVHINGANDQRIIHQSLTALTESLPEKVYFVMTPAMAAGRYNGLLPKDTWSEINEMTG